MKTTERKTSCSETAKIREKKGTEKEVNVCEQHRKKGGRIIIYTIK